MNAQSAKLTPSQRKEVVLPVLKKELERLPEYDGFGSSNKSAKKELISWINELESSKYTSEEIQYFMREDDKWKYSCLCDYLP